GLSRSLALGAALPFGWAAAGSENAHISAKIAVANPLPGAASLRLIYRAPFVSLLLPGAWRGSPGPLAGIAPVPPERRGSRACNRAAGLRRRTSRRRGVCCAGGLP